MPIDSALTKYTYLNSFIGKPLFYVANENGSSISAGSKATFNQVVSNPDSVWSLANNRFTAPANGYYEFNVSLLSASADGTAFVYEFRKNGTTMSVGSYPRGYTARQYTANTASGIILLNENDYIEIWIQLGTMHSYHCHFSGKRVG
jgi:hypothetical protein